MMADPYSHQASDYMKLSTIGKSKDRPSSPYSNEHRLFSDVCQSDEHYQHQHYRYTSPAYTTSTIRDVSPKQSPPPPLNSHLPVLATSAATSTATVTIKHKRHSPTSSPSSYTHETDPFGLLKCRTKDGASKPSVPSVSPMLTTNGWLKDAYLLSGNKKPEILSDSISSVNNTLLANTSQSPMSSSNEPLAQLLITLKEQNKSLIREIEDLRIKLEDAEGDLKLVRCQMRTMSKNMDTAESTRERMVDETILSELEFYKEKVLLLERDIQSLLDEKEELIITRDELRHKNERLNEHLVALMRGLSGQADNYDSSLRYDVDALYLENRYFKEKIKNEEEEKRLLLDRLSKYKELMEEHKRKDEVNKKKFCNSKEASESTMATFELPGGHAISARDIERMIASNSIHSMEVNKSNQVYLWNLLVALFDGLQTKNMNLVHARKTNRLLGKRVEELETHLHSFPGEERGSKLRTSPKSPIRIVSGGEHTPTMHSTSLTVPHHAGESATTPTSLTKETSTDDDGDNDELSSTGISTPSTTRHSLSIEQHLQALQNDALDLTPTQSKIDFETIHLHGSHSHLYEFKRDFDTKPTPSLYN